MGAISGLPPFIQAITSNTATPAVIELGIVVYWIKDRRSREVSSNAVDLRRIKN